VIKAAGSRTTGWSEESDQIKSGSKREGLSLDLVRTRISLKERPRKRRRLPRGLRGRTNDVRAQAAEKLRAKGVDLLVANDVSQQGIGFEADDNQVVLLDRWGGTLELPRMTKIQVAHAILDRVLALRAAPKSRRASSR
jgi:phosphopantothenoylcysteine decarboxylase/phosphopantothenate--cysteine ligase